MKKIIALALLFFTTLSTSAQDLNVFFNEANVFFKTYVSNGKVAYSKISKTPNKLNEILKIAEGISISQADATNYQAFWINAYNLAVIKGVVDNYPIQSPLDKAGFFDKIQYELAEKKVTLNDIENKLLRAKFKDARFHFVLVCGAIGCPPLISQAYLPSTLDMQLETQTRIALNGAFLKVNAKNKSVEGSEILKWYKEDFTRDGMDEIEFINTYRTEKIASNFKLTYFPYNWKLNKQ